MRKELEDVISLSRTPSLNDRCNHPYFEAVVTDVLRCGNVTPMAQHACNRNVSFNGFTIPKGTMIMVNLHSILFDPDIFKNAEKFYPERFVDENGKFSGSEKVVPFSIGK